MTTLAQLIDGAAFRADLDNSDRVSPQKWGALANDAVLHAWKLAASARPDFQAKSQDFTVTSGGSASFTVPSDFFGLIDVVFAPDTDAEYSLGPFAWQNRRSPGGWLPGVNVSATGGSSIRLMGTTVYIEPSSRAGGTYRLWYCPKPTTLAVPDFTVRALSNVNLPGATVSSGAGVGHTITSTVPGTAFLPDGVPMAIGDRVCLTNTAFSSDRGIYAMTALDPYAMVRATDFDSNNEIAVGKTIFVTEGATLAQTYWTVSAFTNGLDAATGGVTIIVATPTPSNTLDPILDPFTELLSLTMAITAIKRDERASDWANEKRALESELTAYFKGVRTSYGPQKMVDTDSRGPRALRGGW